MSIFDKEIDRVGTNSKKWDQLTEFYGNKDLLAMWVADMDFQPAVEIQNELKELAVNEVLGYVGISNEFYETVTEWQKHRHKVHLNKEDILLSPGVVGSIGVSIQAFTSVGDGVLIHDPVYPAFNNMVKSNDRKLFTSPLIIENGRYIMDFEDIEQQFKTNNIQLFIFSNPQNPGGRVWNKEEIITLLDLCLKYNVILLSDEIHNDLVYPEHTMISALSLGKKYENNVVILHSATKTFNIAGVKTSLIFVKNPELKERLTEIQEKTHQDNLNTFGLIAAKTAFKKGDAWLNKLMEYLFDNRSIIVDYFDKELPEVQYMVPEASYLFWFKADNINIDSHQLCQYFADEGKIALNDGLSYGKEGAGWLRLNFGTQKENVYEGLKRIKSVFDLEKQK